ncbi:UbiD family decarboxylase [Acidobacteria bacterium AH-259-D05]|nr:UbiD family decarboxylase [Acidobacteria bacterium AH-259-D05]
MAKDLRTFLEDIEGQNSNEVVRIKKEVDPLFGATGILAQMERQGDYRMVIFENVKGSKFPAISNVHADAKRVIGSIGIENGDIEEFIKEYSKRESNPLKPKLVGDGPVREVIKTGDEFDVRELPIFTYHEKDAGAYITAGFGVMRDADSKVLNAGIYRLMVKGKDKFGIQLSETAHGHYIWAKNEKKGKPTEMAVVIGHHPAFYIGSLSFTSLEVDEFSIAGAMLGEPLELVKCETLDLEVPAHAEMVLECEIIPGLRESEAPFGEYPGTYGPERMNPIVKIKAVTMRKDAYYQESFVGHPDNLLLSGIVRSSAIMKTVKIASPTVRAVHMPTCGRCRFICYIALEKIIEGEPKNAAMGAFVADPFLKYVIVVDDDVNILDDGDVLHAIATRVRADTDTFVVTHAKGSPLDPASYDPLGGSHIVTKVGIDATRKENYPEEIKVPGMEKINLSEFIDQ